MKRYEDSFVIEDSISEVWDFLTQFSIFGKMKVIGQDPANYRLFLNAPINFNTLGENMEIVLDEIEAVEAQPAAPAEDSEVPAVSAVASAATRVIVRSESKLRTAIMDMGKNRKNVQIVVDFIKEQLV
ncbi:MAG: hypothetical protein IJO79_05175 [Firmicutes bacterium]|nr:hypothetical protein [Bacillota bacterium]